MTGRDSLSQTIYDNPNGTNAAFDVSIPFSELDYIDIFYAKLDGGSGGYCSTRLFDPDEREASLNQTNYIVTSSGGHIMQVTTARVKAVGSRMTFTQPSTYVNLDMDGRKIGDVSRNENKVLIYRVDGTLRRTA